MSYSASSPQGVTTPPNLTAAEAVAYLRRLIALDGAFYPCINECGHISCEVESRVLDILERVR